MKVERGGDTYRRQAQSGLKFGEGSIVDVICTEAESLCPAIKVAHQPHLLSNTKPHDGDFAVRDLVQLTHMGLHHLQTNVSALFLQTDKTMFFA